MNMQTMWIEYADGRHRDVLDEYDARCKLEEEFPEAVFGEWQYNVKTHQRMLVWENEEIAGEPGVGDDGSHAVAEIIMDEEEDDQNS
jgi:hypothetical protein